MGVFQSTTLGQDSYDFIKGVDINFLGDSNNFILSDVEALKNKVLFWLMSMEGDYVREPDKGGLLYSLLGKTLTEENLKDIKSLISSGFQDIFGKELRLLTLDITPDRSKNNGKSGIVINMTIKDLLSFDLFRVAAGVEI